MKLPFNVPFTGFADLDFISVFASIYVYLEKFVPIDDYNCAVKRGEQCSGCGNCKKSTHGILEQNYFLFDTVTGRSSLRCRFDGTPTEMQIRLGETHADDCGTPETVDFLFGFTGYDYEIVTDKTLFVDKICDSVNNDRPVIAKVPGDNGRFRVIIGFDGENLLEPDYNGAQAAPTVGVKLTDIEALYLIKGKIPRRFTMKDAVSRIVEIMEYNENSGLWDEYEEKMGWYGGMEGLTVDEMQQRMKRTAETMWHTFNCHNFAEVFRNRITEELKNPALDEINANINPAYGYTHDLAWSLIGWNDIIRWDGQFEGIIIGYAEAIQLVIHQIHENDRKILTLMKNALVKL